MPMIDVRCGTCGHESEIFRHISQMDDPMPNCENGCDWAPVERIYVYQRPHSFRGLSNPVVVYRNSDGTIGIPGSKDARIPEGSERIELRTSADVQRISKEMGQAEYRKFCEKQEREEQTFGAHAARERSELRQKMQGMSQRGQDFARAAMKQNDEAPRKRFQTNVFFDAFENNASNRDGYRGEDHRQGRK